ncbi:hypothetical protein N7508_010738 [Penicillium antarcticum]|uniref:uncharacterized protein n=1 Tax=Penicillium antarcticum TaxID=416450 RepID=UPI002390A71A|nr:uncharacterized protein N7508_010738 [Penicillium antarcticum]KAJ5295917.1 hypothetical protein N7508_010738 [Penicillium antarcticum]
MVCISLSFAGIDSANPMGRGRAMFPGIQEGILLSQLRLGDAYLYHAIMRIDSCEAVPLDARRLSSAWQQLIERHTILRTVHRAASQILQAESDDRTIELLQRYDHLEPSTTRPPHRPVVVKCDEGSLYFRLDISHALMDGTAMSVLIHDLVSAYSNQLSVLPAIPYSDYVTFIQSQSAAEGLVFWSKYLHDVKPCHFPSLVSSTMEEEIKTVVVPVPDNGKFRAFCQTNNITLANVIRLAWSLVLQAYSGEDQVCFGYLTAGREIPVKGLESAVGLFINMLVCATNLAQVGNNSVIATLQHLHHEYLNMLPYQHVRLAEFHHALGVTGKQLFNTVVSFQRRDVGRLVMGDLQMTYLEGLDPTEPISDSNSTGDLLPGVEEVELSLEDFDSYPLVVECFVADDKVIIEARYDENILSNWRVQNIMHHFEHILEQITEAKCLEAPIASVALFSDRDLQQIIEWNREYPESVESTVPAIFADQVSQRPEALAVDAWNGQLAYEELDQLSTTLARHLVSLGVVPEALVPMCFDKSKWAVVAQMAVMKAGGACVNLDPAHPQARLETIVKDAQAIVLLTNFRHANILANSVPLRTVAVTEDFIYSLAGWSSLNLPSLTPRNAAYVVFTSGSTGKPKGIIISHGSLCSSSKAHGTRWDIGPGTRLMQFAASTFDVSCADIFTTLQRGGCICVPSDEQRMNDLSGAISKFQCNWAFLTPTVAALLEKDTIPSLKMLVLGGEASTRDTIAKWHNVLDLRICYGPAECSVYCSGAPPATINSDPANLGESIGALYWIADPQDPNRLTPLGCVGELLLEGPTLAREYLHDVEKTAKAFITSPVWAIRQDSRFYRTGDLVRVNEDGTIRFVGRKDTQVKVRGQRVELGEIEHAIRLAMPTLAHVSVDAVQDPTHQRQVVVAFLHYSNRSGPVEIKDMSTDLRDELAVLQQTLSQQLPSYMIPSTFIPLSRVPLTMNGKSDRRQLRELVTSFSREDNLAFSLASSVKLEPTTPMELQLRALWAKVLHIEEDTLGKNHHFLRSGGDSISAMKLTSHARSAGLTLTVQDIFQAPVLEEMAIVISLKSGKDLTEKTSLPYTPFSFIDDIANVLPLVALVANTPTENIEDILPASDFQSSAIAHSMLKVCGLVNYLFLDSDGEVPWTLAHVQNAWALFLEAHGILRTVFAAYGDRFYQVVLKDILQQVAWYQIDEEIESFCLNLCKEDVNSNLPLGSVLTQLSVVSNQNHHRLILRVSHAQYEGVCLPRIWQSFQDAFSGRTPAPEVPFSHFIAGIYPASPDAHTYWRNFSSNSTMTDIVAHPAPQYQKVYDLHLTRTITIASQGGSVFTFATILKTAWALVLSSCSDRSDVVFGHVVSGRNLPQANIDQVIAPA